MDSLARAALATVIERYAGYPDVLMRLAGHPVQAMGWLIAKLDSVLNIAPADEVAGRLRGTVAMVLAVAAFAGPAWLLARVLAPLPGGWLVDALLATTLIAQSSLRQHVADVAQGLARGLPEARSAVAKIVGRETAQLDEAGVTRAALESLAENTADGIVAPVFWYAVAGLPGLVAYKVVNTADSMIGHKSDRHLFFGWAAARLDDVANLPAARLTALLFAAAAALTIGMDSARAAWASAWRDAGKHRSPNAGWPEAAMAGALGLRFGGPRSYDNEVVDLPWMGDGRELVDRSDIARGLALYDTALWLMTGLLVVLAVAL